jgi:general nucleoside transport system permease protein
MSSSANYKQRVLNLLVTIVISMAIGAILMAALGYNPLQAYSELFKGAFVGRLNFGTTLTNFVPLLLTAFAFVISSDAGVFNCGVEGEMYLGAITAAYVGYTLPGIPGPLHILLCFVCAMIVGSLWAIIPAVLKINWGVNEVCVTILMNYVAQYITSYLVNGPFSAKSGTAQTPQVPDDTLLPQFLLPSQANVGLFLAIGMVIFLYWLMNHSTVGFQIKSVGMNPAFTEYVGIDPKKAIIGAMILSGAIGAFSGCISVLGVYGYFLDNFSNGLAFNGMLAALIIKNDYKLAPVMAFFIAMLQSGAQGMERNTGVPKSIVDTIICIFIVFATMEALFALDKFKRKKKESTPASASQS